MKVLLDKTPIEYYIYSMRTEKMISRTTLEKHERGMIVNEEREMERHEAKEVIRGILKESYCKRDETIIDLLYDHNLIIKGRDVPCNPPKSKFMEEFWGTTFKGSDADRFIKLAELIDKHKSDK